MPSKNGTTINGMGYGGAMCGTGARSTRTVDKRSKVMKIAKKLREEGHSNSQALKMAWKMV
jgi:hypothetical protein